MTKTVVALMFGGESSEHDISIMSARNIYTAIDRQKYELHTIYIDLNGSWWLLKDINMDLSKHGGEQLLVNPSTGSFIGVSSDIIIKPDVLFPILHGKNGEDGTIQGLADMSHIPYVGCGVEASAICMDKLRTKEIAINNHIKTAKYIAIDDTSIVKSLVYQDERDSDIVELLGDGPWFVKPSRCGSSIGVSKVESLSSLEEAVNEALKYDKTVLIEEAIAGREIEVAILGNPPNHKASGVGEIIAGDNFYSYNAKYSNDSKSQVSISPDLPHAINEIIRKQALKIYSALDCRGLSRIDFFVTSDYQVYFNEVNTMPGFTDISMYPKLWAESGISYAQLTDKLIQLALE